MKYGRWIAPLVGLAMVGTLALPAEAARPAQSSEQTLLNAAVITAQDVPSSWTSAPQPDIVDVLKGISACSAVRNAEAAARKRATRQLSPIFTDPASRGQLTTAENEVDVFPDAAGATKLLKQFQASSTPTCLRALLFKAKSVKQVKLTKLSIGAVGDANVGYEAAAKLSAQGTSVTVIVDIVAVRVGRAFLGFHFSSPGKQIAQGPDIVNTVANRVRSAGA